MMLICVLVAAAFAAYQYWFDPPPPPPPPLKTEPVVFSVKSRTRLLFEEWKRRQLIVSGPQGVAACDMADQITEIQKHLFFKGLHQEAALQDIIRKALQELGVASGELDHVVNGIISEANVDASNANKSKSGGSSINSR